ncbi:MAG: hypothetical protein IJC01_03615 [Clostridia bacterium]|nr:hypothetical protein [Clostridia bacterium]
MLNCFNNNCYLYILIILLIAGCGGCFNGILEKLCNCECLIPILLALLVCGCKERNPFGGNIGCGCK